MDISRVHIIGAETAVFIYTTCILIFIFRLSHQPKIEYWIGLALFLSVIPLLYLLSTAKQFQKPPIFYIQICIMIGFLLIELIFDYILKVDFRNIRWMTITYIMIYFAGIGGMIGVASHAGKGWATLSVILFFCTAALAFFQRAKTGL
jgi:hypothetical protein